MVIGSIDAHATHYVGTDRRRLVARPPALRFIDDILRSEGLAARTDTDSRKGGLPGSRGQGNQAARPSCSRQQIRRPSGQAPAPGIGTAHGQKWQVVTGSPDPSWPPAATPATAPPARSTTHASPPSFRDRVTSLRTKWHWIQCRWPPAAGRQPPLFVSRVGPEWRGSWTGTGYRGPGWRSE
jgi:hypothetical protein